MHYGGVAITLYLFWLLLSGHTEPLLLGAGALSVAIVLRLSWRMDRVDGEPAFIPPRPALLGYGLWLLWSVVRANIDVVKRIWTPGQAVEPQWRRLDTGLRSPLELTLYANSITLTPGTLTTDVRDDHLLVHCLDASGYAELAAGEMEQRIQRLGL